MCEAFVSNKFDRGKLKATNGEERSIHLQFSLDLVRRVRQSARAAQWLYGFKH
jgi:hypothetical protein